MITDSKRVKKYRKLRQTDRIPENIRPVEHSVDISVINRPDFFKILTNKCIQYTIKLVNFT